MKREYFILGCNSTIINNTSFTRVYVMAIAMTPNASDMIDRTEKKKNKLSMYSLWLKGLLLRVIPLFRISAMCEIGTAVYGQ